MNFREKIANYILGNFSRKDLPEIAMTGLEEGLESASLYILAGMNNSDDSFVIEKYFNDSLKELDIVLLNEFESAKVLLKFYLRQIIDNQNSAFETMRKIDQEVYKQVHWVENLTDQKVKYVGEELGLEKMFTWYRELQDFDGGLLFYYNDLPKNEQKKKFEWHLIEEAKELKEKIEMENYL